MAREVKSFEELSSGEKYRYYRKRRKLAVASKWGCIIAPFGIVFGVKFNEYVQFLDTMETVKLSIGCVLAIVVAAIAVYKEFKHSEETKHLAPAVGWGVALAFAWLFQIILQDLVIILGAEFVGQCAAAGLDVYSKRAGEEMADYKKIAREDRTLHTNKKVRVKVKAVK